MNSFDRRQNLYMKADGNRVKSLGMKDVSPESGSGATSEPVKDNT